MYSYETRAEGQGVLCFFRLVKEIKVFFMCCRETLLNLSYANFEGK